MSKGMPWRPWKLNPGQTVLASAGLPRWPQVFRKDKVSEAFSFRVFIDEFRNGIKYIRSEKGLMVITLFFFIV